MSEQVITTRRGKFGKFQVTLPIEVKLSILDRIDQSGLRPSEYLRISLILGSSLLAKGISDNQLSGQGGN
ncbi:MAG: hypothetical protein JXB49_07970 [Bacteroidales bacterium]|nr:hypothetical protein [Bacteroidales bacterium]